MGFISDIFSGQGNKFEAQQVDVLQGATPEQIAQSLQAGQGLTTQQQALADVLNGRASSPTPIDYSGVAGSLGAADQATAALAAGMPIDYSGANASLGRAGQAITGIQGAGAIDFSGANASLGNSDQVLAQLMATGRGQGPNPALEQLKQTTGENIQRATGLVASQKGVDPAMAARAAALAAAQANQGAAGQAATLSAQQQITAQQQAAQVAQSAAAQRASQAQAQAQQGLSAQAQAGQLASTVAGQQAAMAGAQAQQGLATTQQAGALAANLAAQKASMSQAQTTAQQNATSQLMQQQSSMGGMNLQQQQLLQQALANYNSSRVSQANGVNQANGAVAAQNAQSGSQLLGGILSAAGAVAPLMLSDERVKQNIVRHNDEVIEGVPRATFEYRAEPGQRYEGVIAQDVEATHPEMVAQTASGLKAVPAELGPVPVGKKRTDKELAAEAMEKIKAKKKAKGGEVKGASDKEIAAQALMHRVFGRQAPRYSAGDIVSAGLGGFSAGMAGRTYAPPVPRTAAADSEPLIQTFEPPGTKPSLDIEGPGGQAAPPTSALSNVGRMLQAGTSAFGSALAGRRPAFARGGEAHPLFVSDGAPEVVPGRASVPTAVDSESADRVPAWLTPGEGVLPRSVMQAPDAPEQAKSFVEHLVATRRGRGRARAAFGERRAS